MTSDHPVPVPRPKPFRFGVQVSSAPSAAGWRAVARKAEDLGYATLTVADHLDDQFATTPALMAAADATTTLRLGALVYANDYHHPVVLAKEAATLDLLSDGRLELGLGAGWLLTDYQQAGIPLDPPGDRIERMAEAVRVVKGLLADEPCTVEGRWYRVTGLDGRPKPVQRPHPPLLIGGGGRHILSVAAREADIVGLNINLWHGAIDETAGPSATAEATVRKLRWLHHAAPERFDDLELQVRVHIATITDDPVGLAEILGPAFGLDAEHALHSPHALAGTVEGIAETCRERRERFGISYVGIGVEAMEEMAPVVELLAGT
ncbi:MAG: TIGR03621 family F420-dependent LLM class oxidoreductase [Acidimicrobiales bacterium]|jgi:probable F420-dependent oxidoreductase|nr:TIGR03621 family F420-dependent LLM class oxidoreductase [Acidimicrobiales bacterium]